MIHDPRDPQKPVQAVLVVDADGELIFLLVRDAQENRHVLLVAAGVVSLPLFGLLAGPGLCTQHRGW